MMCTNRYISHSSVELTMCQEQLTFSNKCYFLDVSVNCGRCQSYAVMQPGKMSVD